MKVLIAYYSETGNTEKIAKAVHEEVSKEQEAYLKQIRDVSVESLSGYQLVFLGAPCHDADLAMPLKRFLDSIPQEPQFKLAGFFTHATFTPEKSARSRELYKEWAGKCSLSFESTCHEKNIEFLGYFHCQGVPSPPIEAFIRREIITSDAEWEEYLPEVRKHPSPKDLKDAKAFARKILENEIKIKKSP